MLTKLQAIAALIVLTATVFMVQSVTSTAYAITAGDCSWVCASASVSPLCAFAKSFGLFVFAGSGC
jgi:hypothetical protein